MESTKKGERFHFNKGDPVSVLPHSPPKTDLGSLSPVGRESLQERVYQELSRSLVHGAFEAGQVLRMQALADTLDVSIMPVREALARLVSENALEVMPSRSVRVPLISDIQLTDLMRARCLVEGELVRLAIDNLTPDDLDDLKRQTKACEDAFARLDAQQAVQTSVLNHDFHFSIYRAANSRVLLPVVRSLWLQSGPYVRTAATIYSHNPGMPAVHHHWALIEALEARDPVRAEAALRDDITQSFTLIRTELLKGDLPT